MKPQRDDKGRIIPYRDKLLKVKRKRAARRGAYQSGRRRPSIQIAFYDCDEQCRKLHKMAAEHGYKSASDLAKELLFGWMDGAEDYQQMKAEEKARKETEVQA